MLHSNNNKTYQSRQQTNFFLNSVMLRLTNDLPQRTIIKCVFFVQLRTLVPSAYSYKGK